MPGWTKIAMSIDETAELPETFSVSSARAPTIEAQRPVEPVGSIPETLPWEQAEIPEGYEITLNGLYRLTGTKPQRISGPVWVEAQTRNESDNSFGIEVAWIDRKRMFRTQAVPCELLHERGCTLVQQLARHGLEILPSQEKPLRDYLTCASSTTQRWRRSADQLGWLPSLTGDLVYVLPDETISSGPCDPVVFQPKSHVISDSSMLARGTLAEWNQNIARLCAGNPLLVFSLCMPFAASLLKHVNLENGGIHFYGRSSQGKTTAAQVAASVVGCGADPADCPEDSRVQAWHATANALEGLAAAHNDSLLILDEIHTCGARDFASVAYFLTGGRSKGRMGKDIQLRAVTHWNSLFLSTGEISVRQRIAMDGKTAMAGQLVRFMDIPIHEGIVQDTHGRSAADFVQELKGNCSRFYGTAIREFLRRVVTAYQTRHALRRILEETLDAHSQRLIPSGSAAEHARGIRRCAFIGVAGKLAVKLGVLELTPEEIDRAVRTVIRLWLSESADLAEPLKGALAVRDFVLRFQHSRFEKFSRDPDGPPVRDRAGYISFDGLFLFTPAGFKEACGDRDCMVVAQELRRRSLLATSEADRLQSRHRIDGKRVSVYAVKDDILEFDDFSRDSRNGGKTPD